MSVLGIDNYFKREHLDTIQRLRAVSQLGRRYVWFAGCTTGAMGAVMIWANGRYNDSNDPLVQQWLFWLNQVTGIVSVVLAFSATGCCLLRTSDADNSIQDELRAIEREIQMRADQMHNPTEVRAGLQQLNTELRGVLTDPEIDWVIAPLQRKAAQLTGGVAARSFGETIV